MAEGVYCLGWLRASKMMFVQKNNGVGDNTKAQIVASDKRGPQTGVESIKKSFSRVP